MAYALEVPDEWRTQGWKVKIRDDERNETPHATILRRRQAWRLNLRTGRFMDSLPDPADVPEELVGLVWKRRGPLRRAWDAMYPENPVFSEEDRQ
jgi:hypothetical protein